MNLGTEDKKKLAIAGGLGVVALGAILYAYNILFGGPSTPPPAATPVVLTKAAPAGPGNVPVTPGSAAVKIATVNGQLDPTLHMGQMIAAESLVYSGTGRNVFGVGPSSAPSAPALIKANFPARPTASTTPQPIASYGPPPPPPINLKFFGIATRQGVRRALLLSGDDVFLATPGDIVERRYRIISIATNSITVEDMPNSNKQSIPLVLN